MFNRDSIQEIDLQKNLRNNVRFVWKRGSEQSISHTIVDLDNKWMVSTNNLANKALISIKSWQKKKKKIELTYLCNMAV